MIIIRQKTFSLGDILGNGQNRILAYKNGQRNDKIVHKAVDLISENASAKGKGKFHAGDRNGYVYQVKNRFINSSRNGVENIAGESFNATTYIDKGEKLSTAYKHHLKLLKDQGIELTKKEKEALKESIRKGERKRILRKASPYVIGGTLAAGAGIGIAKAIKNKKNKDKKK